MKASELRIGNLVYGVSDRIETVIGLTHNTATAYVGKLVGSKMESSEDDYRPIPLTEKLFRKLDEADYQFVGFGTRLIFQSKKYLSVKYEYSSERVHVYFNDQLINIKEFVHDWQNIHHALTGDELFAAK